MILLVFVYISTMTQNHLLCFRAGISMLGNREGVLNTAKATNILTLMTCQTPAIENRESTQKKKRKADDYSMDNANPRRNSR